MTKFPNPFKPGAGHRPPYLAGRDKETAEFKQLLKQDVILQNLILSGLRGIGKTVLLESFKPVALENQWLWAGTDCSEASTLDEDNMVIRLLTDVALITSNVKISEKIPVGFHSNDMAESEYLDYRYLLGLYSAAPGLPADKLKLILTFVWQCIKPLKVKGIIFAYDEAQTLSDHAEDKQYPLSMLLDVFQYIQKNDIPFMLVLTGLPTLLVKLVETRTYSERLFRVLILDRLTDSESELAIVEPIKKSNHPLKFNESGIKFIIEQSGGYPYFIQFICREAYDFLEQQLTSGETPSLPIDAILHKLDSDFFAGRWEQATDRERELLTLIATADLQEFGVAQVSDLSKMSAIKPFSSSQISQMFNRLIDVGLIYKNRRGSYSFAVPLLEKFILRKGIII